MQPLFNTVILILVFISLAIGIPIFYSLAFFSILGFFIYYWFQFFEITATFQASLSIINSTIYDFLGNYNLGIIPLFIAMGNLASKSGIIKDFYSLISYFLRKMPGGLAIATILGCGGFSAISGSSVVCAATLGRITIPEMIKYGYKSDFSAATVAAGGTLGSLIPPSILLIIYSYFSQQSIQKLFLAAIFPGLLTLVGYCLVIFFKFRKLSQTEQKKLKLIKYKKISILKILPIVFLSFIISGIYFGFFTVTESAALSLLTVIIISLSKKLSINQIWLSLKESVLQTTVIFTIAIGAKLLTTFLILTNIIAQLITILDSLNSSAVFVLVGLILLYLILGMFLDSIGILVLTLPFVIPIAENLGWNLIWFGILIVKLLEIGLITPPVGLNVFVIQTAFPKIFTAGAVFKQISYFLISDFLVLLFLACFPVISIIFALL